MKSIHFVVSVVIAIACGSSAQSLTDVCKDRDRNCATWKKFSSLCDSNVTRQVIFREEYCRETCQLCITLDDVTDTGVSNAITRNSYHIWTPQAIREPPKEKCYLSSGKKSKYGCCWDGRTPVQGPNNKGCPVCEDAGSNCRRFKRFCVDTKSSARLRNECPETCGYCPKAASPCYDESGQEIVCEDQCYDIAPEALCEKRRKVGFCSNKNWQDFMKTNCAKACYFCGDRPAFMPTPEPECYDRYGGVCELHMGRGRCTDKVWVTWMKKNCAKTCGFCD